MSHPYGNIKKLIKTKSPLWEKRLNLTHWDITHTYLDSYLGDDGEDDYKVSAITETRWQYMTAKIKWYLPACARHTNTQLEKILLHELCHVLLSPEQTLIDAHHTHTTQHEALTETEHSLIITRNYELLELTTEQTTKALWNAYHPTKP